MGNFQNVYETDTRMREWSTASNGAKCLGKIKIYSFQLDFFKKWAGTDYRGWERVRSFMGKARQLRL